MSPAEWYAIALAGILVTLVLFNVVITHRHVLRRRRPLWVANILFRAVFRRHDWPSWTWSTVVCQLLLVSSNATLVFCRATDIESAARNAGQVAILDMVLFYLGPHFSFLADVLGVSVSTVKSIHSGMTLPFVVTIAFHAVVLRPPHSIFATPPSKELYGVIVSQVHLTFTADH